MSNRGKRKVKAVCPDCGRLHTVLFNVGEGGNVKELRTCPADNCGADFVFEVKTEIRTRRVE